ncbi:MAG: STAS domain-containing protein [Candidatus Neomarinimicrobiota bacterium]
MLEIEQQRNAGLLILRIDGRIDSLTAQTVQQCLENLIEAGERQIVVDFSRISYISSAGLRVLLLFQKQLKKVEGEIALANLSPSVMDIFRMSGFSSVFRILNSLEEIPTLQSSPKDNAAVANLKIEGVNFESISTGAKPGRLNLIGSQQKMAPAEYGPADIISVRAGDLQYGLGFAALGDDYESVKNLFGEALIVNGSLFYYPAVKRPAVDYMLVSEANSNIEYKFFFGFNITGQFSKILAFECQDGFIDLKKLAVAINEMNPAKASGVVLIAESKGLLGMFLKRSPIIENKPANGQSIYSSENFAEWMDFPVEPTDINRAVIACGLAIRDKAAVPPDVARLLPDQSAIHLHAAVFEKGPLNKKAVNFDSELKRIINESEVSKVMHILDGSRFGSGLIGLIDLEF